MQKGLDENKPRKLRNNPGGLCNYDRCLFIRFVGAEVGKQISRQEHK